MSNRLSIFPTTRISILERVRFVVSHQLQSPSQRWLVRFRRSFSGHQRGCLNNARFVSLTLIGSLELLNFIQSRDIRSSMDSRMVAYSLVRFSLEGYSSSYPAWFGQILPRVKVGNFHKRWHHILLFPSIFSPKFNMLWLFVYAINDLYNDLWLLHMTSLTSHHAHFNLM